MTLGVGSIFMAKDFEGPVQPFAIGVTVIVATIGVLLLLTATKELIFPAPAAANPMEGLLFVQL